MPFDFDSVDTGATAWVLASGALVLLMTPGLAFFYGGMVRAKHVLAMLMQNFVAIGIVSLVWVLCRLLPRLRRGQRLHRRLPLRRPAAHRRRDPGYVGNFAQVIPPMVFVDLPADVRDHHPGADHRLDRGPVEVRRVRAVRRAVVDPRLRPVAHWVFSPEGWLFQRGALGLRRRHRRAHQRRCRRPRAGDRPRPAAGLAERADAPHNVPFVLLGAGLLWFGWFGFNAGSALGANGLAGYAFVNTNTATAAALLGWLVVEKLRDGKATTLGAASGAVAGLVAITPCAGFVSPLGSIAIGLIAGGGLRARRRAQGQGSASTTRSTSSPCTSSAASLGSLCVGCFATMDTNPLGADGLFYGGSGWSLLGKQALAVGLGDRRTPS